MVPTLFDLLGIHGAFLLYSSVGVFVGIYSYFHMPETSGLSLEQIEEMYRPVPKRRIRTISACWYVLTFYFILWMMFFEEIEEMYEPVPKMGRMF